MLSVLAEFQYADVRVVSVADNLDSSDEESTLGIQIRGIFNELQLRDLKKSKTLRGLIGQKQRAQKSNLPPVYSVRVKYQHNPCPKATNAALVTASANDYQIWMPDFTI